MFVLLIFCNRLILSPILTTKIEVDHSKTHTVLINSNFNCGFYINREVLFNILKTNYHLDCIYDPCSYPGIQCKFFYYKDLKEQTGIQRQDKSEQIEVSFMIFRTGSVLIVGKWISSVLHRLHDFELSLQHPVRQHQLWSKPLTFFQTILCS